MSFRLVRKSVTLNDLERRSGPYLALLLRNLVVSGANCVKVIDKTITMDNLRIQCLVVNVCRGTARRHRYIIQQRGRNSVADAKSQDFMRSTCASNFSFKFLYSFRPNHARKLGTQMLLAALNNIYITGLTT